MAIALLFLGALGFSSAHGKDVEVSKAWERNWKQIERHDVLELGGMNTKKAALRALPFWLGQTGLIARMDREKLRYVVTGVTKGSPSDGLIKEGDVLVGANGKAFARPESYPEFVGPQVALGNAMLESWGKHQGQFKLDVVRDGKQKAITLTLPGRGMFGASFPEKDALADAMISAGCSLLVARQLPSGAWSTGKKKGRKAPSFHTTSLATLALMASDEKRWRSAIKRAAHWLRDRPPAKHFLSWHYPYLAIVLGEYYLLTKDSSVKPVFQRAADLMVEGQFDYYGSGHSSYTGNYRGNGISVCTTHVLLGLAYAKRCGAKVPSEVLGNTMDHIERISPHGGVPYVIWGRTEKALKEPPTTPNKRNEHATRTGTALIAFRMLDGHPAHQKRMSDFLARNSDYMDNGHATANTLSWLWGSWGLACGDSKGFADHMRRRAWWIALKWRHDAGTMSQPAECVNFRGSDHALGPHADVACQVAVLAAPRRTLLATGRADRSTTSASADSKRRLVSLARWDHHHGRLRRLDLIPALIKKKVPLLADVRNDLAALDPDKPSEWSRGYEKVAKRLPKLCRQLQAAAKNEYDKRACVLLATAIRPSIDVKLTPKGLRVRGRVEQIPFGSVSLRLVFDTGGKGRASVRKLPANIEGNAKGGPLDRAKHEAFRTVLKLKGKAPTLIDLPATCHMEWQGVTLAFPVRIQHGTNPHRFAFAHRQPLIRVPLKITQWGNEGVLLSGGLRDRLTLSCNQVGALDGGAWRLLKREERTKKFPPNSKVWCSLYDLGFHRPFVHQVQAWK